MNYYRKEGSLYESLPKGMESFGRFHQCILFFREAEAQDFVVMAMDVKRRNRNGGYTNGFGQVHRKIIGRHVADAVVGSANKIAAGGGKKIKSRSLHVFQKEVAFLLQKGSERKIALRFFQVFGQGNLCRSKAAESIELMDLSEFSAQCFGCHTVSQFPTGAVVYFPKGEADKASLKEIWIFQHAVMGFAIKGQVFVYFITDQKDLGPAEDRLQCLHVFIGEDAACWIVGCIDDDRPCPIVDGFAQFVPVDLVFRKFQFEFYGDRFVHQDVGDVAVVCRLKEDHFITGLEDGSKGGVDGIGSAGSDGDLVCC
jgi:hypothetical protein